ncbi:MAG: hypothetical protein OXC14_08185 [Rhodospirillaceae bacterium]|nr:hypothetical protein [Rhodospirillaceae bacterium]
MGDGSTSASSWDFGDTRDDLIHRIHPYPARFPAFITTKALEYAKGVGVEVRNVADVFCGCGTTAVEAKRNGKDFWGCDINPLATLIAHVKTHRYRDAALGRTHSAIRDEIHGCEVTAEDRARIGERIRYWFDEDNIEDLIRLDRAIRRVTYAYSAHRKFFQCAFSAILKPTSYWLTKSIKAQRDPNKRPRGVLEAFDDQFALMRRANQGNRFPRPAATTRIRARNFLGRRSGPDRADLIVTSPPYVTSYNYADIHQLSTLWLGYAADYRALRRNMLGNRQGVRPPRPSAIRKLGDAVWRTYQDMRTENSAHASSIAKYFVDLDKAVRRCWDVLEDGGIAVFVIGNTQYKGVKVNNAEHLETSMGRAGFESVHAIPRKISLKTMTPYRDARGCFTRDASQRQVYAEEFVLIGRKA